MGPLGVGVVVRIGAGSITVVGGGMFSTSDLTVFNSPDSDETRVSILATCLLRLFMASMPVALNGM